MECRQPDLSTHRSDQVSEAFGERFSFATATLLLDGSVVVMGGYDDKNRSTAGIWRYR